MRSPRRIVFKLSGEMLSLPDGGGIDPTRLGRLATQIGAGRSAGAQLAFVVGGGNIVRGAELERAGVQRTTADQIGMLGTVINALALGDALAAQRVPARVMSAIGMTPVVEPYDRAKAVTALEEGVVVVCAAGTGNPYFTTDTAASLRAAEFGADLLAKATKVPGVFDKDPAVHPDANLYARITYDQVLAQRLEVMDATAIAMCRENQIRILVFQLDDGDSLVRVAAGALPGTVVEWPETPEDRTA